MDAKANPYKTMWHRLEERVRTSETIWDKYKIQAIMREIETRAWRDRYQEEQEIGHELAI